MRLRRLMLLLFVVLPAACSTTGTTTSDRTPQHVQPAVPAVAADIAEQLGGVRPPADRALIYLYRPERYVGSANIYRITLNDTPVADMRIGTRLPYAVLPGETTLAGRSLPSILNIGLSLGLMEKPYIVFETEAGRVYFIDVKTGFAGGPQFEFVGSEKALEAIRDLKLAEPLQPDSGS